VRLASAALVLALLAWPLPAEAGWYDRTSNLSLPGLTTKGLDAVAVGETSGDWWVRRAIGHRASQHWR